MIKIATESKKNVLIVDKNFVKINNVSLDGNQIELLISYKLSQVEAIQNSLSKVIISTFVKSRYIEFQGFNNLNEIDKRRLETALKYMQERKSTEFLIIKKDSDVTSKINNKIVSKIYKDKKISHKCSNSCKSTHLGNELYELSDIQDLYANKLKPHKINELKSFNENLQLLCNSNDGEFNINNKEDYKRLMFKSIFDYSQDPSEILYCKRNNLYEYDSFNGLGINSINNDVKYNTVSNPLKVLFDSYIGYKSKNYVSINDIQDENTNVISYKKELNDIITVTEKILLNKNLTQYDFTDLVIKFELINSKTQTSIDQQYKNINLTDLLELYYTPYKPPTVLSTINKSTGKVTFEIKQQDEGAYFINVYKKSINNTMFVASDYKLLELEVEQRSLNFYEQPRKLSFNLPLYSTDIYRFVSVGKNDTLGYDYCNVVVQPINKQSSNLTTIIATSVIGGVRLEAINLPVDAISIEFLYKNVSYFDKNYTSVNDNVIFIDSDSRTTDVITTLMINLIDNCIYEYAVRIFYKDGKVLISNSILFEYIKTQNNIANTIISDKVISMAENEVSFTITSEIVNSNIDTVKNLLEQQNIYDLYADVLKDERDKIKKLIAHNVQRIDLMTGQREDFGVIDDGNFSDQKLRGKRLVSDLIPGHQYRYEIYILLRTPETMFENFIKNVKDIVTNKMYSYSPYKWRHPIIQSEGMIISSTGARLLYAKDDMLFGNIGLSKTIDISYDLEPISITNFYVNELASEELLLQWNVYGNSVDLDHFLVIKEQCGILELVGKCHTEFRNTLYKFIYQKTHNDMGDINFKLIPIFNDYGIGDLVSSNVITLM